MRGWQLRFRELAAFLLVGSLLLYFAVRYEPPLYPNPESLVTPVHLLAMWVVVAISFLVGGRGAAVFILFVIAILIVVVFYFVVASILSYVFG